MKEVALKPLEKLTPKQNTYIEEKKYFYPTWAEWAAKNREQVMVAELSSSASDEVIYTVPEEFNLFITSAFISISKDADAVGGISTARLMINTTQQQIFAIRVTRDRAGYINLSNSFPMPLKLNAGDVLIVRNPYASSDTFAGFQGFLEKGSQL